MKAWIPTFIFVLLILLSLTANLFGLISDFTFASSIVAILAAAAIYVIIYEFKD